MSAGRRTGNKPWKHIYGVDRKYTARVDRLAARRAPIVTEATVAAITDDIIERYRDALEALGDQ